MDWDGSGVFSRIHNWVTDAANSIGIVASRHDAEDDNLREGIQACLTKNNESKPTADFAPNSDNAYDLGTAAAQWKDAHLSGSLALKERGSDPAAVADKGRFYAKDVSGITEVFYIDSAGTVTQITTNGKFPVSQISAGALPAGVTLPATQVSSGALPAGVTVTFRGALVYLNATYAVATTTPHVVGDYLSVNRYDEAYDTDSIHDPSTNYTRLTVPAGVTKVRLVAQVYWDVNATGIRSARIRKNASIVYAGSPNTTSNSTSGWYDVRQIQTSVLSVVAGDYFELEVQQTTGGNLNIIGGAQGDYTWFGMEILA